ncbi:hypothetical protein [Streptomyces noursei]|uniref:hypothetical protein n=1 Tax=Streptomyces noursei TaxID=1971 RepID=UPI0037FE70F6
MRTDREERDGVLLRGLGRGIRAGRLPVERVLAEVGPAETVLTHLPLDDGPTRKALVDLLDHLPDTLRRRTGQLLTTPDGLESLRCQLAEAEAPEALTAYLTASAGSPTPTS